TGSSPDRYPCASRDGVTGFEPFGRVTGDRKEVPVRFAGLVHLHGTYRVSDGSTELGLDLLIGQGLPALFDVLGVLMCLDVESVGVTQIVQAGGVTICGPGVEGGYLL